MIEAPLTKMSGLVVRREWCVAQKEIPFVVRGDRHPLLRARIVLHHRYDSRREYDYSKRPRADGRAHGELLLPSRICEHQEDYSNNQT